MNISGLGSNVNMLAEMASNMKANNMGLQISTAVLKEALDTQKQQAEMLTKMINQTPSADGAGRFVNILA